MSLAEITRRLQVEKKPGSLNLAVSASTLACAESVPCRATLLLNGHPAPSRLSASSFQRLDVQKLLSGNCVSNSRIADRSEVAFDADIGITRAAPASTRSGLDLPCWHRLGKRDRAGHFRRGQPIECLPDFGRKGSGAAQHRFDAHQVSSATDERNKPSPWEWSGDRLTRAVNAERLTGVADQVAVRSTRRTVPTRNHGAVQTGGKLTGASLAWRLFSIVVQTGRSHIECRRPGCRCEFQRVEPAVSFLGVTSGRCRPSRVFLVTEHLVFSARGGRRSSTDPS